MRWVLGRRRAKQHGEYLKSKMIRKVFLVVAGRVARGIFGVRCLVLSLNLCALFPSLHTFSQALHTDRVLFWRTGIKELG